MTKAARNWNPDGPVSLVDCCVAALEAVYVDSCVEECLRRRAQEFVDAWPTIRRAA